MKIQIGTPTFAAFSLLMLIFISCLVMVLLADPAWEEFVRWTNQP